MRASTNVNIKDKYGFTVLHHAVYRDNTLVVTTLLKENHLNPEVITCANKYSIGYVKYTNIVTNYIAKVHKQCAGTR